MTGPYQVKVTRRAEREIAKAGVWWREHRQAAPEALRDELENAFRLLAVQPRVGARATNVSLRGVRRIHLGRVQYHLYYRVRSEKRRVEILALWHTRRGRDPGL